MIYRVNVYSGCDHKVGWVLKYSCLEEIECYFNYYDSPVRIEVVEYDESNPYLNTVYENVDNVGWKIVAKNICDGDWWFRSSKKSNNIKLEDMVDCLQNRITPTSGNLIKSKPVEFPKDAAVVIWGNLECDKNDLEKVVLRAQQMAENSK